MGQRNLARTIVHLSDLHFGRVDVAIPPALLRAVAELAPDLVVVSGDVTQRARIKEFKAAADFLGTLPAPLLAVPGNHDVPLYNLVRRWLWPLDRFRRYITSDLTPFYEDSEIAVLGVNTARALTFKDGRINRGQIDAAMQHFAHCGKDVTRIVVTHHAFDTPDPVPGVTATHKVVGRATMAMAGLMRAGVDMILSGHLHLSGVGETTKRYPAPGRAVLLIQAGTATSTRRRGEVNAFNVVRVARHEVTIACMAWRPDEGRFVTASTERFNRTELGWARPTTS
jgi:3',5'-cyclic AMP phosphodiesterase CpdA